LRAKLGAKAVLSPLLVPFVTLSKHIIPRLQRKEHSDVWRPDLIRASLNRMDLSGTDLSGLNHQWLTIDDF